MSSLACRNNSALLNNTLSRSTNCTNGTEESQQLTDLYSSTAKIIAYSTVYGVLSFIAIAGMISSLINIYITMHQDAVISLT